MKLARELHMGLGQMWASMTEAELLLWQAFYMVEAEDRRKGGGA